MKITRYKFKLGLGLLFAVAGLFLAGVSVIGALDNLKPHGWQNIVEMGVVGVLLLGVGVGFCYDKDAT